MNQAESSKLIRDDPKPASSLEPKHGWANYSDRIALIVFACYLLFGAVFLLFGPPTEAGWFGGDDWIFLTTPADSGSLFQEHFGHWVGLPFLMYRLIFTVFGITSYLPYLALAVGMHLTVVALLRVVMRRAGTGGWVSTIVASTLVLFAAGAANFLSAFQVTLVGSMALGLGQLLVADHDGPIRPRDWAALPLGLAALMFSGVGVMMLAVVGAATLIRRGIRVAAFQTLPPLGAYLVWRSLSASDSDIFKPNLSDAPAWFADQFGAVGIGLLGPPAVALFLSAACLLGLWLAWRPLTWAEFRRTAAAPLSLGLGAVVMSALTWWSRGLFTEFAVMEKYVYLQTAALLPLVAIGLNELVRRRTLAWLLLVPLILVTPLRVGELSEPSIGTGKSAELRATFPAIAGSPLAGQVPRGTPADPTGFFLDNPVTVGWLLDAAAAGKLPEPPEGAAVSEARIRLTIGVSEVSDGAGVELANCQVISPDSPATLSPEVGDHFSLGVTGLTPPNQAKVEMELLDESDQVTASRPLKTDSELILQAGLPDLVLRFTPARNQPEQLRIEFCSQ